VPQTPYTNNSVIKYYNTNSSGIYKLKSNTYNNSYVELTGRSLGVRHKEQTRYIKTNNPVPPYAQHILNNKRKYKNIKQTIELLKPCNKGVKMNIWESFSIHFLQKQNVLIEEQKVSDPNPLFELAQDVALHN